jgi:hypothetical protein
MGNGTEFDTINKSFHLHDSIKHSPNLCTENVEKVIWDNVLGPIFRIMAQASAFTKTTHHQPFVVVWDIWAL